MAFASKGNLKETYVIPKREFPQLDLETFLVVENTISNRFFWKPETFRIILFAESHFYTTLEETNPLINYSIIEPLRNCSRYYLRLVYYLG
jgi:hypothetical protein